jgi:hypothetical protein
MDMLRAKLLVVLEEQAAKKVGCITLYSLISPTCTCPAFNQLRRQHEHPILSVGTILT